MFFKLSILLLYFIIAGNSVLGESEDENEIFKESYDDCRKWLHVPLDSTISMGQFLQYMGKKRSYFSIMSDYVDKNPTANENQDSIDLYLYGELFKMLCSTIDLTVKKCAAHRKSIAAQRTLVDVFFLGPVEPEE
ncbi:uncharacterized protein LOC126833052 isoform X1 [Adelges cooleyi]|uniref:uncharacterized protein LOC126833052 isoform X1 n=1 Tax=Adelges cooleyi TaxID=133065 RepID=UPI00217F762D|nr:uncharacterized protein LOC126833052 isoform X1 [Adelges cooleyi]